MNRRGFIAGLAALPTVGCVSGPSSASRPAGKRYDHVVVGGGFAGVSAALASARCGAKTCLVERTTVLGGLSTQGHVIVFMPLCDGYGRQVTFGIAEELLRLPMKYSAAKLNGAWENARGKSAAELSKARYELVFDPGPMMLGLERLLVEAGVDVLYDADVVRVERDGSRLTAIAAVCGGETAWLEANAFTDASGAAALAKLCEAPTVDGSGNEACGWYYAVNDERKVWMRCGAGRTYARVLAQERQGFGGGDPAERTEQILASHRAILADVEEENRRLAEQEKKPIHVFSIPTYPTLRVLRRVESDCELDGKSGDDLVGIFSDWRRKGPVYALRFGALRVPGVSNLLAAGRCLATNEEMWDVIRCLPGCCASGQAAGTAAAFLPPGGDFAAADVRGLQRRLMADGVKLDSELLVPHSEEAKAPDRVEGEEFTSRVEYGRIRV